jgi:hypothetical protein
MEKNLGLLFISTINNYLKIKPRNRINLKGSDYKYKY